jgi:hypothetical protein
MKSAPHCHASRDINDNGLSSGVDSLSLEEIRRQNGMILKQQDRINELKAYLDCIVALVAKVREYELEHLP